MVPEDIENPESNVPSEDVVEEDVISEGEVVQDDQQPIEQVEELAAEPGEEVKSAEPVLPQELQPKNTIYFVLLILTFVFLILTIWFANKEADEQYASGFLPFLW